MQKQQKKAKKCIYGLQIRESNRNQRINKKGNDFYRTNKANTIQYTTKN